MAANTNSMVQWQERAVLATAGCLLALIVGALSPMRTLENHFADLRISHLSHPFSTPSPIVIVAIDDESLESLPFTEPLSRKLLSAVLETLDKTNPRAIGLDILLDRPTMRADDTLFTRTVKTMSTPLVVVSDPGTSARTEFCRGALIEPHAPALFSETLAGEVTTGHGVLCVDGIDGVVRTARFSTRTQFPTFAEAVALAPQQRTIESFVDLVDIDRKKKGRTPLPFRRSQENGWPFPTISAAHLDIVPDAWFTDKYILVGRVTPYSRDWHLTPLRHATLTASVASAPLFPDGKMPGVLVHAFALETLLAGIQGPEFWFPVVVLLTLIAAAIGMVIGIANAQWWVKLSATVGIVFSYWFFCFILFRWTEILLPLVPPILALVWSVGISLALLERRQHSRRREIHQAFRSFLAPDVVDNLVRHPQTLRLQASEREISVLFTDLAGFTSLIDTIAPAQAADTLNGYLDVIVETVMAGGGVVDKIVGDAVHVLFSAPVADPDHRCRASLCALEIRKRTEIYKTAMESRGIPLGKTRIGLNAGPALVGNFGGKNRLDYTAHGTTINLAARLEAANKMFGTSICVSEAARCSPQTLNYRQIGMARLRGVHSLVRIFELTGIDDYAADYLQAYEAARDLMEHAPERAVDAFEALSKLRPDDNLTRFQLKRLHSGYGDTVITV